MTILDIIINYRIAFLKGLWVSTQLAAIIWMSGLVLGTVLALLSKKYKQEVGVPARVTSFILSGVPILVFLF